MAGTLIYNLAIRLYQAGVKIAAATGNRKARLWLQGRQGWAARMKRT